MPSMLSSSTCLMSPVPTPLAALALAHIKDTSAAPSETSDCINALIFMSNFLLVARNVTRCLYTMMNVANASEFRLIQGHVPESAGSDVAPADEPVGSDCHQACRHRIDHDRARQGELGVYQQPHQCYQRQ